MAFRNDEATVEPAAIEAAVQLCGAGSFDGRYPVFMDEKGIGAVLIDFTQPAGAKEAEPPPESRIQERKDGAKGEPPPRATAGIERL